MRCKLVIATVLTAATASAAEAPWGLGLTAMLLGANDEVGGVDEVDTYPQGLPQVEPEVASPRLRPEPPPILPPPFQPEYRPLVPPPLQPPAARAMEYRTVMEATRSEKHFLDIDSTYNCFAIKFLFKRVPWKTEGVPTDRAEEQAGVASFTVGGVPPGQGELYAPGMNGAEAPQGPEGSLKVYLSDWLPVEGYAKLFFYEELDIPLRDETLVGFRAGFVATKMLTLGSGMTKDLTLWYGREIYEKRLAWDESFEYREERYKKEWDKIGAEWLFEVRNQQFMLAFEHCSDAPRLPFLLGPLPTDRLEFSWFPYQQLRVSFGFKNCPGSWNDSSYFRAKWDVVKTLSVGCHFEDGTGDSDFELRVFSASLRF